MSSGVGSDENYAIHNPTFSNIVGFAEGDLQDKFTSTLVSERTPEHTTNVSIDTHVLGMIIVKATGKSLPTI